MNGVLSKISIEDCTFINQSILVDPVYKFCKNFNLKTLEDLLKEINKKHKELHEVQYEKLMKKN